MVLAGEVRSLLGVVAFVALCALVSTPAPASDPKVAMAVSLARAFTIYAFLAWAVLRREALAGGSLDQKQQQNADL